MMSNYPDYVLEYQLHLSTFKIALKFYKKGEILYEKERYEDANKLFKDAIDTDHNYVDAYFKWGMSLFELKDYNGAIDKFKTCTILDSNYVDAYHYWGHSLEELGNYDEAIEQFKQGLEIDPGNSYTIHKLICWGELLYNINKYDEAIDIFKACNEVDSNYGYAYRRMGDIFYEQGKYFDAREQWKRAKKIYGGKIQDALDDKDTSFFSDFGRLLCCDLEELKEDELKAEYIYKKGLELDENDVDILIGLVHLYISHKNSETDKHYGRVKFRRAENILKEKLSTEKASVYLQLGKLYIEVGEYEEAEKNLLKALDKERESADTCLHLGILYLEDKKFEKSIKYLKRALEIDYYTSTKIKLADAYYQKKLYYEAEEEYKEILDTHPYNIESLIGLGNIYIDIGDISENEIMYEDAIIYFDKIIDMMKSEKEKVSIELAKEELADIYYKRGYVKVKLNRLVEAMNDFNEALRRDPFNDMTKRSKKKIINEMGFFIIFTFLPTKFEKICEKFIFISSIFILFSSWYLYYNGAMDVNYLAIFSFLSLIFVSLSPFLSYITKLKIQGIEIEKSSFTPKGHNKIDVEKSHR